MATKLPYSLHMCFCSNTLPSAMCHHVSANTCPQLCLTLIVQGTLYRNEVRLSYIFNIVSGSVDGQDIK
jgi:hypothetical protein